MSASPSDDRAGPARPASQIIPQPIEWLWPGRLACGKLAMLDGDPERGKSLVTLDLCARLSTGRPLPDGSPVAGPCNSLVLNGEDGTADTFQPRLKSLGADLDRVFFLHGETSGAIEPLRLPSQAPVLAAALVQTGARLVVIDPIMAFLDQWVLTSSDQSVRRALFPLAQLAELHRCVIILVRHFNKTAGRHAMYRGGGSIGFLGACRSGWMIAPDPEDPQRRILAQVKNNLAAAQPSLAYQILAAEGAQPTISWLGTSPLTANQLLAGPVKKPHVWPRAAARELLNSVLEAGPRTSREIWEAAEEQGLTERTLRRAKEDLEIRTARVWADGRRLSYWLLPNQQLPASVTPDGDESDDLEPWLAPLRKKYPPSTPIDDL